jgi:leucyl-tRNA synthetase
MSSDGREAAAESSGVEGDAFAAPSPNGQPATYVYAGYARAMEDSDLDCTRRFLIGDAYARFRRDRGDSVLFALGVESSGEAVEQEAARASLSPDDLTDQYQARMRERFECLGVSCDWDRTVVTSHPAHRRHAQLIFLALLEQDLAYRREVPGEAGNARWFLRSSAYAEQCEQGLGELAGWTVEAIETQRAALGRVDGVEMEAELLGVGKLAVFTPYPESIEDAEFVAISPNHPQAGAVASPTEMGGLRGQASGVMVQTGTQAVIPGVSALLPVVVAPSVDARFGPTASLGVPGQDETDREIASKLEKVARLPLKAASSKAKPGPSARYRLPDLAISRAGSWGTPVPVVHCQRCAAVPNPPPEGSLPAEGPEPGACSCPRCGEPAEQDPGVIDSSLSDMWMWLSICVPPADRESSTLSHAELERWLPARQVVWSASGGEHLLHQRVAGRVASDLGIAPSLQAGEPFSGALVHGQVSTTEANGNECVGGVGELDELVAKVGADVARLTILNAASPAKAIGWSGQQVRHSQRFLAELREFAEPRLRLQEQPDPLEIDRSTRLRRRLAAWCRIAEERISTSLEQLAMHRATFDTMRLLERIQDFEDRCTKEGELEPEDRDAVFIALLKLVQLSTPIVPSIAAELQATADS